METFLFLNVISLTPIILTNMLTFKSWYEREDAASSIVEWLKSAVIAAILSLSIAFLYDIAFSEAMREVYKIVTIWEFVIFAYVSSLFTFWIIKKIDKIFILLSVTSFSALFMFITPLMFSLLEIDNVSLIAILSFGFGGFIGSGVAIGVNKDIRKVDLLASLSTFIQIFALGETFTQYLYQLYVITPNIYFNIFVWFVTFIIYIVFYTRRHLLE